MPNTYDIGDRVEMSCTLTRRTGELVDPDELVLKVQDPDGLEYEFSYLQSQITRIDQGMYACEMIVDKSGTWYYRFESYGAAVGAGEVRFDVRPSQFTYSPPN